MIEGAVGVVEHTLGGYKFCKNTQFFSIESPRGTILKAYRSLSVEEQAEKFCWILQCSGESFVSYALFWEYISQWLEDVQDVLWPRGRSAQYLAFLNKTFREEA